AISSAVKANCPSIKAKHGMPQPTAPPEWPIKDEATATPSSASNTSPSKPTASRKGSVRRVCCISFRSVLKLNLSHAPAPVVDRKSAAAVINNEGRLGIAARTLRPTLLLLPIHWIVVNVHSAAHGKL